jgi:hypothetical protein
MFVRCLMRVEARRVPRGWVMMGRGCVAGRVISTGPTRTPLAGLRRFVTRGGAGRQTQSLGTLTAAHSTVVLLAVTIEAMTLGCLMMGVLPTPEHRTDSQSRT